LLLYIPPKDLIGLKTIILTNRSGLTILVTMGGRLQAGQARLPDVVFGRTNREVLALLVKSFSLFVE
jgi:hypothetical protein